MRIEVRAAEKRGKEARYSFGKGRVFTVRGRSKRLRGTRGERVI